MLYPTTTSFPSSLRHACWRMQMTLITCWLVQMTLTEKDLHCMLEYYSRTAEYYSSISKYFKRTAEGPCISVLATMASILSQHRREYINNKCILWPQNVSKFWNAALMCYILNEGFEATWPQVNMLMSLACSLVMYGPFTSILVNPQWKQLLSYEQVPRL